MKLSKKAKALAEDLGLSDTEAVIMEFKSKLYAQASEAIRRSKLSHEEIAKKIGTSRARITRIANMGENSVSMELLVKIIVALDNKLPIKFSAA